MDEKKQVQKEVKNLRRYLYKLRQCVEEGEMLLHQKADECIQEMHRETELVNAREDGIFNEKKELLKKMKETSNIEEMERLLEQYNE